MLFSRLQRNEAHQSRYPFDFIPGSITGYWSLYFAHSVPISFPSRFFPYFDTDIRAAVIFEGIEVVEQAHGLFAPVREHQFEVRESLSRVKLGLFHHHGTFHSVVGHVPPRRGMEGQACKKY